ncbi:hypothetical protein GOP47_0016443 [Adiantum capillus-veneris]|uniref:Glycosyltransferase n=1 Tax=Adiantum capillus-veneris TaxID=13818 RepID=A0A9D4UHN4_ADICA|nr:hypothetical protein GOP47_0016443 [Adiantum capillus-veneris]
MQGDEEDKEKKGEKGMLHLVALPFPVQGHMAPMLQLCNLLASRGLRITFVHLQSNFSRLHFSHREQGSSDVPPPNVHHVSLPASLPGTATSNPESIRSRVRAIEQLLPSFVQLLSCLHARDRVSCIIADALMSWAHTAGSHLGIPGAALWTGTLSSCAAYCNIPLLASHGVFPIQDMVGGPEQPLRCIPKLPKIFTFADLPSFFHAATWPDDVLDFILLQMNLMNSAKWVLSNSLSLEPEKELEESMKASMPIMSIGPLVTLQHRHFFGMQVPNQLLGPHPRASLWHEDATCLEWLQGRPSLSVLYVSFGSIVAFSTEQLQEIAMGLESSQQPFLWALRPDSIEDKSEASSKYDQISRRSKVGLVVPWAPQVEVLAHASVGGFMTHCGWNSLLESILMGKPMIGFPQFAEQKMNCRLMEHWRVGMKLPVGSKGEVDREQVKSCVNLLMNNQEENAFRVACTELRAHLLNQLFDKNGPSSRNVDDFIFGLFETDRASQSRIDHTLSI